MLLSFRISARTAARVFGASPAGPPLQLALAAAVMLPFVPNCIRLQHAAEPVHDNWYERKVVIRRSATTSLPQGYELLSSSASGGASHAQEECRESRLRILPRGLHARPVKKFNRPLRRDETIPRNDHDLNIQSHDVLQTCYAQAIQFVISARCAVRQTVDPLFFIQLDCTN